MRLVLQPCGDSDAREHFVDTIENLVPLQTILEHAPSTDHAALSAAFPNGAAVWGVTPGKTGGNKKKWDRMEVGDIALLYRNKQFFFMATVAYKMHSRALAEALWSTKSDNSTWEYAFLLSDLEPVEIDIGRFNKAAGYADEYIVQGFNVLDEPRSEKIAEELELDSGRGQFIIEPNSLKISPSTPSRTIPTGDLDGAAQRKHRREQRALREALLGNRSHDYCAICSRHLPVDLLVAGHIRKRNSCDDDMKRDLANVMPVCLLGCDILFENGYIFVNERGQIAASDSTNRLPEAKDTIAHVVGRYCRHWNDSSSKYFEWHRQHRRRFS